MGMSLLQTLISRSINPDGVPDSVTSWDQRPQAVGAYIDNVDYTDVPYTASDVADYAPETPVRSNEKPVGAVLTVPAGTLVVGCRSRVVTAGNVTITNLIPGRVTPWSVVDGEGNVIASGALKPTGALRLIDLPAARNCRDLGGWACDGGTVRYGLLFRSGNLANDDKETILRELGIRAELDLTADGIAAYPGELAYYGYSAYAMYALTPEAAWAYNLSSVIDCAVRGVPLLFHCSMGADRTGTLAAVLLGILGVAQSDIDKDYELTSFYAMRARNGNYQGGNADWDHLIEAIEAMSGNSFRDKCVSFALSCGITVAEINAYRAAMIEGTPATLTPTVPNCTVTKALTGCAADSSADSVDKWQPYEAVITPNSGYALSGITVLMGGTDVTATAVVHELYPSDRYVVRIGRVTGNLSITAAAERDVTKINQIPISIDTDSSVFNGTGYKEGYRLKSSGAESAASGYVVTGFMPFEVGKSIFVDKFDGTEASNGGLYFYNASFTCLACHRCGAMITAGELVAGQALSYTPPATIYDDGAGSDKNISTAAYIRLSIKTSTPGSLVCRIN